MPRHKSPSHTSRMEISGISASDQALINIASGNIIQNIQQIQQRALSIVEEAQQAQTLETEMLAQGVARLAGSLGALANQDRTTVLSDPYRGLLEYRLADAQVFYGRQQAIAGLWLRLQRSPLTVLHSESGAGKTSLLQAGIAPRLLAAHHLPLLVRPYDQNPVSVIKQAFITDLEHLPGLQTASLRDFLVQVASILGQGRALFIFLDQFEEFFTRLPPEEQKTFVHQLAACKEDETLPVCWVLSLRSEAFSDLAFFQPEIQNPFENEYRLNRLTRSEAVEVVALPALSASITFQDGLVETILNDLGGQEISPPEIQLVCSALVQELPPGQTEITQVLYKSEGFAEGILRSYLGRVLQRRLDPALRKTARLLLEALVSSKGQRLVRAQSDLVEELRLKAIPPAEALGLLEALTAYRLLRSLEHESGLAYELAHDYLLGEIRLDPEVQARKAAQELLAQEARAYQQTGSLIAPERLKVIQPFVDEISPSAEERLLIEKSQQEANRQAAELEAQRQRELEQARRLAQTQRQRALVFAVGAAVSLLLLAVAIFFSSRSQSALSSLAEKSTESAQNLSDARAQSTLAVHAETLSRAQKLSAQGQAQFELDPLLGLRLGVEGLDVVPWYDEEERESIRRDLAQMASTGRLAYLGNDVENVYLSTPSDRYVIDRLSSSPGELRRLSDNALVELLSVYITSVSFSPDPAQAYFLVISCQYPCKTEEGIPLDEDTPFNEPQGEVHRSLDGSLVPLSGSVEKVEYYTGLQDFVFITYDGGKFEVRPSFESPPLDLGESLLEVKPLDVLDGTFFEFYDAQGKALVRLDAFGQFTTLARADSRAVFTFSPAPDFPYYFIDNPGLADDELRRLEDPDYRFDLGQGVLNVYFSPNLAYPFMVLDHYQAPGVLYFPDGRSIILGQEIFGDQPNGIANVIFSPNPKAAFFIVCYRDSTIGAIYNLEDGSPIDLFNISIDDINYPVFFSDIPDAPYFVARDYNNYGLHDNVTGKYVTLVPYDFKSLYFSENPDADEFIISRSEEYGDRYGLGGNDSGPLSGFVQDVYFSPPGSQPYTIVDYAGQQAGEILDLEKLPGEIDAVMFGPKYLVINYTRLDLSQLRLLQDASLVMEFPRSVSTIFSDLSGNVTYFQVGETQLWDDRSGFLLDLGLGVVDLQPDWADDRMFVHYRDGRLYLLDLHWLSSLGSKAYTLSTEDLIHSICTGPLSSGLYNPAAFLDFLDTPPALSCP